MIEKIGENVDCNIAYLVLKLNEVIGAVNQIEVVLSSVGEVELRSGNLYEEGGWNEIPAK